MKRLWQFLPALPALMLSGCTVDLLQPRGPIGEANRDMMVLEFAVMLCVVIPTCIATLIFGRKYRASNTRAEYRPNWAHSTAIEWFVWIVPLVIIVVLSCINFWSTHAFDPYKPLSKKMAGDVKPLRVQVVSLDWKWLFIYPDQGIATINELDVPTKTPLNLTITSDTVMSSFFIPQLGSMIYDMAGQQTQLHLLASVPGVYRGEAAQYTGKGFSDMKFRTIAMPEEQFQAWVSNVQNAESKFDAGEPLDAQTYPKYSAPQVAAPVKYFAHAEAGLFDQIIAKYNNGMVKNMDSGKIMHMQQAASGGAASSDTGM